LAEALNLKEGRFCEIIRDLADKNSEILELDAVKIVLNYKW